MTDCVLESQCYIEQHLEEILSIEIIANHVGYSKYYFSRLFQEQTGMSVMQYVRKRKLLKASQRITAGEKIMDVALIYGWQSHAGFIKAFKGEFGIPPSFLRAESLIIQEYGGVSMKYSFLKEPDCHAGKEELYNILKEVCQKNRIITNRDMLEDAYQFACSVYAGYTRHSGDEYITHPLNVAILLADMNADENTIIAGLFVDALTKTNVTADDISKKFSKEIAELIISSNNPFDTAKDNRDELTLIKLAERLHNMRTVKFIAPEKWQEKARETYDVFLPIAQKVGNENVFAELKDLSMKYL